MRKWMALGIMAMLVLCGCGSGCAGADAEAAAGNDAGDTPGAGVILVTAFEPFGGEALNPTELVLEGLDDTIGGYAVHKLLLPVEFIKAPELAIAEYDRIMPAAVIMLGEAGGRSAVTPETRAENVMNAVEGDFTLADNAGFAPDHRPIVEGGPDTLQATLPVDGIIKAVNAVGVPCERSYDVGQYVCNTVMYSMLEHNGGAVPTGFIHVPYIRQQGHEDEPYMELEDETRGIAAAIEAVAATLG